MDRRVVSSLVVSLSLLAGCEPSPVVSGTDAGMVTPGTDGGGGGGRDSGGGGDSFTCCINDSFYECPDRDAFVTCTGGFDLQACLDACAFDDPTCPPDCFDQQAATTPDPSQCVRDASRDGTCGTSSGSCDTAIAGDACEYDSDCASSNCTDGHCYGNEVGNLCEYDDDCTSSNCTEGCCYGNDDGERCEYDDDCASSNCTDGTCYGDGGGERCEYDDDCASSNCTDGYCV